MKNTKNTTNTKILWYFPHVFKDTSFIPGEILVFLTNQNIKNPVEVLVC